MRSASSVFCALALLAVCGSAGCGTWSNEDIAFVEALPTQQELRVTLPAEQGQALCAAPGRAAVWDFAKTTGDGLNAGVDAMLAFVDFVKRAPPTRRRVDAREWGPFDDQKHPGREVQIRMTRTRDDLGVPTYEYFFEARREGGGEFSSILDGRFRGESARAGSGEYTLHFETLWDLGMNDEPTDPHGDVRTHYDRTSDPRTLSIDLAGAPGFGLEGFDYGYTSHASGQGGFHYAFVDERGWHFVVDTRFDATGAGRADVIATLGTFTLSFHECWDAAACITFVQEDQPGSSGGLCPDGVCPSGACPALE